MLRNHKPPKVSQAINQRNRGEHPAPSNGHRCPKSPSGSHWWCIESPNGATSDGVCRYCGEQRRFANTLKAALGKGVRR